MNALTESLRNSIRAVSEAALSTGDRETALNVRNCLLRCADDIARAQHVVAPHRVLEAVGIQVQSRAEGGLVVFELRRDGQIIAHIEP